MSFISIGDLSSSMRLRFLNADLKSRIGTLSTELASGKFSDQAKHLGGNLSRLGSVTRAMQTLEGFRISNSELTARGGDLQSSLAMVQQATKEAGAKAVTGANTQTAASIGSSASAAEQALETVVSAFNTKTAGRSLFAGQASNSGALISAPEILDELSVLVSGLSTAGDVEAVIDDYFNLTGGGFETSAYLGSVNPPGDVRISETETAGFAVSANAQGARDAISGLATAALLGRGILAGDLGEQSLLLKSAGEGMLSATEGIVSLRAEIGAVQARLEVVEVANSVRKTTLELELKNMVSRDGYETATELQSTEISLEALYLTTSRLSQLSLSRYLR